MADEKKRDGPEPNTTSPRKEPIVKEDHAIENKPHSQVPNVNPPVQPGHRDREQV